MVNSITLVTGQREAYNEVRNTTTIIENKPWYLVYFLNFFNIGWWRIIRIVVVITFNM